MLSPGLRKHIKDIKPLFLLIMAISLFAGIAKSGIKKLDKHTHNWSEVKESLRDEFNDLTLEYEATDQYGTTHYVIKGTNHTGYRVIIKIKYNPHPVPDIDEVIWSDK